MKDFSVTLEGGGQRGMFTAGILDVLMEADIYASATVGVSAGAVFGCNYRSRQIGRAIRYNTKYCADPRYASIRNLITKGAVYTKEFAYGILPEKLDVFDTETFKNSPMSFTVVTTDIETGKPFYYDCTSGGEVDLDYMRASASVPLFSRPVKLSGHNYLDGGISDSIPVRFALEKGYEKNVVVLTQPMGYKKESNSAMPILSLRYKKYPNFVHALATRHEMYNETLEFVKRCEEEGKIFVIRPPEKIVTGVVERDKERIRAIYNMGRDEAERCLDELKSYLEA